MLDEDQVLALRRIPNGSVIWFRHPSNTGRGGTRMFDYAAYQGTNGDWWTTATEDNETVPQRMTEDELIDLLDTNLERVEILQCTDWRGLRDDVISQAIKP